MAPGHLVWDLGDSGVVPRDGESRRTSGSGECCQAQRGPSSVTWRELGVPADLTLGLLSSV